MKRMLKLTYVETRELLRSPTRKIIIIRNNNSYEIISYLFTSKMCVCFTPLDNNEFDTISYNKKALLDFIINALEERMKKNEK